MAIGVLSNSFVLLTGNQSCFKTHSKNLKVRRKTYNSTENSILTTALFCI